MENNAKIQAAMQVSTRSIVANIALSLFKLAAGLLGRSAAMVSDAVHSASDVFSTVIVIIGMRLAGKESDADHPYGHERLECVAAIILAGILCATGLGIGYTGIRSLINGAELAAPGRVALVAAAISIAVKEAMYWDTRRVAKRLKSGALMADAWHHRTDALSSVGSFVGILGARMGFPVLDPLACVVICVFIVKAAYDIFGDSIGKMTDKACDTATEEEIRALVLSHRKVMGVDQLKTRLFGDRIYVDVEIQADGNATLNETHEIAQEVHDAIEMQFPKVKHCMVHVNPCPEQQ